MTKLEIENLVSTSQVVLFMKGTPDEPACGFSYKSIQILRALETKFVAVNVLADDELRQNIKEYSEWPTIPQLYVNGKFQGGVDIMTDMYHDKSLKELINAEN